MITFASGVAEQYNVVDVYIYEISIWAIRFLSSTRLGGSFSLAPNSIEKIFRSALGLNHEFLWPSFAIQALMGKSYPISLEIALYLGFLPMR